jgi:UDP:flavonoid glycosyltransferase YjiC (YdhE family)
VAAARAGLAVAPGGSESAAGAVRTGLGDPSFRDNARKVAAQIAAMPSPDYVAAQLTAAL